MAAAHAIVSGGGNHRVPLERAADISRISALASWRPTQGIYRFDPTLLNELLGTPLDGELPTEHLQHLPEWCVYVELERPDILGFFAHLEYDANDERTELRLLLDCPGQQLVPLAAHLGGTLEQAMAGFIASANEQMRGTPMPALGAEVIDQLATMAAPLVSVLLYLCAGDAEMRPTRDPKRTHEPVQPKRAHNGDLYLPPARRPEVWETGFQLGSALRSAAETGGDAGPGRGPRGHIRRAHWHSYWMGVGESRRLALRWLPPIAVKLDTPERATMHKVKE